MALFTLLISSMIHHGAFLPLPKGFQFYCTNLIKAKLLRLIKEAVLSLCAPASCPPPHEKMKKVLNMHIK